jgi:hypothetical protein
MGFGLITGFIKFLHIVTTVSYNIFMDLYTNKRSPLLSSGQSSWLQIQKSGFDSRRYQNLREIVDLERSLLRLVSKIKGLLGRNNNGPGLEN